MTKMIRQIPEGKWLIVTVLSEGKKPTQEQIRGPVTVTIETKTPEEVILDDQ